MADIAKMTKVYVKIRDARAELKREFEAKDVDLKAQLEKLESAFLRLLEDSKLDSMKTEFGTVYRSEDTIPQAEDWDKLYAFIREHDAFEALEKRITKRFVKDFMEANEGRLPPGVKVFRKFTVNVRRS